MLSMQHIMCAVLNGADTHKEEDKEYLAAVIFPDAIRAYTGARELSHFEFNPTKGDVSWMKFPNTMNVTKEFMDEWMKDNSYLSPGIPKGPLGQQTHIKVFEKMNKDLEGTTLYKGLQNHLKQDIVYDKYVRDNIGSDRDKIFEDEDFAMYVAAYYIYEKRGITCNKEWFDNEIKPILDTYMPNLADKTYSYMNFIGEKTNEYITNHDWSHIYDGPLPLPYYGKLYMDINTYINEDRDPTNFVKENIDIDYEDIDIEK